MNTIFYPEQRAEAEKAAHQTGMAAGKAAISRAGLAMPTHSSSEDDASKLTFDAAFVKAKKESFEKRFKPISLFHSSCRNFYKVLLSDVIMRFDFSDAIFDIIDLVKPSNARNLSPKSLRPLFERFPQLASECDPVKANNEWREHVNLPSSVFGKNFKGNFETLSVEEYWITVFASVNHLNDPQPRFPNLEICISFLLCIPCSNAPAERAFSQMKLTMTSHRNRLSPITVAALMQIRSWLVNQKKSASDVEIPLDLVKEARNVSYAPITAAKTGANVQVPTDLDAGIFDSDDEEI